MRRLAGLLLTPLLAACAPDAAQSGGPVVGNAEAGKAVFAMCASCHHVGPAARAAFGPQLNGIIGRTAGTDAGFVYSQAMKNSRIVWTEQKLVAFVKDPEAVVPGTKMRFWGMDNQQKSADLLAYLRTFP